MCSISTAASAPWIERAVGRTTSSTTSQSAITGQHEASPSRPTSTTTSRPRTDVHRSTAVASRVHPPPVNAPAWAPDCRPGITHASPASGSATECSPIEAAASSAGRWRVATDQDSSPDPVDTRPGSRPGTTSPPAGSASTSSTGRGQVNVSAAATVVAPGDALPARTATVVTTYLPAQPRA